MAAVGRWKFQSLLLGEWVAMKWGCRCVDSATMYWSFLTSVMGVVLLARHSLGCIVHIQRTAGLLTGELSILFHARNVPTIKPVLITWHVLIPRFAWPVVKTVLYQSRGSSVCVPGFNVLDRGISCADADASIVPSNDRIFSAKVWRTTMTMAIGFVVS